MQFCCTSLSICVDDHNLVWTTFVLPLHDNCKCHAWKNLTRVVRFIDRDKKTMMWFSTILRRCEIFFFKLCTYSTLEYTLACQPRNADDIQFSLFIRMSRLVNDLCLGRTGGWVREIMVEVEDFRKFTNHSTWIYRIHMLHMLHMFSVCRHVLLCLAIADMCYYV